MKKILFMYLLLSFATVASASVESISLKGQILYSFEDEKVLILAKDKIFQITVSSLPREIKEKLNDSSRTSKTVDLIIPRSAITTEWLLYPYSKSEMVDANEFKKIVRLKDPKISSRKLFSLKGSKDVSWQQEYYLIHSGNLFYRIYRPLLSKSTNEVIEQVPIGTKIQFEVPKDSVSMSWAEATYDHQQEESVSPVDHLLFLANKVIITGTVVWSPQESMRSLMSKDLVFLLRKAEIDNEYLKWLDTPGTRLTLSVPYSAIETIWPINSLSDSAKDASLEIGPK